MTDVLIAHPSAELYGSDLQLVETVKALKSRNTNVTVVLPRDGLLTPRLVSAGATVRILQFPVLRRSDLSPLRFIRLGWSVVTAVQAQAKFLRQSAPDVLIANTVIVPTWIAAASLLAIPAICHVHEAEQSSPYVVRKLLTSPLRLTQLVVTNSESARESLLSVQKTLRPRTITIYNGVPFRTKAAPSKSRILDGTTAKVLFVGRLSERKGVDLALEAVARLTADSRAVTLDIFGDTFDGNESFEQALRSRAAKPDLREKVSFHGYVSDLSEALTKADILLVPSRQEPFGNVAVEGQLACRLVIAANVQGLREIVEDGVNGFTFAAGSSSDLARSISKALDDPEVSNHLAQSGLESAVTKFTTNRYASQISKAVLDTIGAAQ